METGNSIKISVNKNLRDFLVQALQGRGVLPLEWHPYGTLGGGRCGGSGGRVPVGKALGRWNVMIRRRRTHREEAQPIGDRGDEPVIGGRGQENNGGGDGVAVTHAITVVVVAATARAGHLALVEPIRGSAGATKSLIGSKN